MAGDHAGQLRIELAVPPGCLLSSAGSPRSNGTQIAVSGGPSRGRRGKESALFPALRRRRSCFEAQHGWREVAIAATWDLPARGDRCGFPHAWDRRRLPAAKRLCPTAAAEGCRRHPREQWVTIYHEYTGTTQPVPSCSSKPASKDTWKRFYLRMESTSRKTNCCSSLIRGRLRRCWSRPRRICRANRRP